jgi:hypothetical protein
VRRDPKRGVWEGERAAGEPRIRFPRPALMLGGEAALSAQAQQRRTCGRRSNAARDVRLFHSSVGVTKNQSASHHELIIRRRLGLIDRARPKSEQNR